MFYELQMYRYLPLQFIQPSVQNRMERQSSFARGRI